MYARYTRNYYRTYLEKRNRIKIFMRATMVVDSYQFLQIPTVTSHFPTRIKDMVTKWVIRDLKIPDIGVQVRVVYPYT